MREKRRKGWQGPALIYPPGVLDRLALEQRAEAAMSNAAARASATLGPVAGPLLKALWDATGPATMTLIAVRLAQAGAAAQGTDKAAAALSNLLTAAGCPV